MIRPRKVFDLQGNQVGSTQNQVTITLAGAAVTEWAPGVGAGTYYVLDYNVGEVRFVNAAGAVITPTNGRRSWRATATRATCRSGIPTWGA